MFSALLLAAAVGQQSSRQIAMGRREGLEPVRPMVAVATTPEELARWFSGPTTLGASEPRPIVFLPYGTRATKGRDIDIGGNINGEKRSEPACYAIISEGPLAGVEVVVRKLEIHEDSRRPLRASSLSGVPKEGSEDVAGWTASPTLLPTYAATSVSELSKMYEGDGRGPVRLGPGVINIGKTPVKIVGDVVIPSPTRPDGVPGVIVQPTDGPAKGRNVVIARFSLASERNKFKAPPLAGEDDEDEADDDSGGSGMSRRREEELAATAAKMRARKSARTAAGRLREQQQAAADYQAEMQARQEFKEMLPFMLENQRQMLNRRTDLERNKILDRSLNKTPTIP